MMRFQFRIQNSDGGDSSRSALSWSRCAATKRLIKINLLTFKHLTVNLLTILQLGFITSVGAQTRGSFTDSRDGHKYQTVVIGSQTWTAENLAFLPAVDRVGTGLFEEECHYVYGYDGINVAEARAMLNFKEMGVLYNWMAAKSACPAGWHLPSDHEWIVLERFLGMTAAETLQRDWRSTGEAGKKLKSGESWINGNGTDSVGFAALPAGCRGYAGFESKGYATYFWTASTIDGDNGWRRGICSDSHGISRQEDRRYFGASVRCIKN